MSTRWSIVILSILLGGIPRLAQAQQQAQPQASLRVWMESEKPNPFIHERFTMVLNIESVAVRLSQNMNLSGMPDKAVLVATEFKEMPVKRTTENGVVRELRRFRCEAYAPVAGKIEYTPVMRLGILSQERAFIGMTWIERVQAISSPPVTMTIRPIPQPSPPEFSGAIGEFEFAMDVTPTILSAGELVTCRLAVSGRGKLNDINPLRISPGRHFKAYDPRDVERLENRIVFEQILVPQNTNAAAVPAVTFGYFSPAAAEYRAITRGPVPLQFVQRTQPVFQQYQPPVAATVTNTPAPSGQDILTALRTLRDNPDNPQAQAALTRLLARHGRTLPVDERWIARIQRLSPAIRIAAAGLLILAGGLLYIPPVRRQIRPGLRLVTCALLLSGSALLIVSLRHASVFDEFVLIHETPLYLAPSENARVLQDAHVGLIGSVVEKAPGWVRVRAGGSMGWIPRNTMDYVKPLQEGLQVSP
jgi:hypothetical protein